MDVVRILRNIRNLETAMVYLLGETSKNMLTLHEPLTIEEVQTQRLTAEYYEAIIKGKPAVTVEDIQNDQKINLNYSE